MSRTAHTCACPCSGLQQAASTVNSAKSWYEVALLRLHCIPTKRLQPYRELGQPIDLYLWLAALPSGLPQKRMAMRPACYLHPLRVCPIVLTHCLTLICSFLPAYVEQLAYNEPVLH